MNRTTMSSSDSQGTTTTYTRLTQTSRGSVAVRSEVVGLGVLGASPSNSNSPSVRLRHREPLMPLPWRPTRHQQTDVWDVSSTSSSTSLSSSSSLFRSNSSLVSSTQYPSVGTNAFVDAHRDETGLRYRKRSGSLQTQDASLPVCVIAVDIAEYHDILWSGHIRTDASGNPGPSKMHSYDVFSWLSATPPATLARFSRMSQAKECRGRGVQREFTF